VFVFHDPTNAATTCTWAQFTALIDYLAAQIAEFPTHVECLTMQEVIEKYAA